MDATDRRQRASEEATEWLVVLQGDVTHTQREQFIDWLRESPVHVAEMLRAAQVHGALEQFNRWARIPTDGSGDDDDLVVTLPTTQTRLPSLESSRQNPRSLRFAWPLAAAVMIAAVALVMLAPHWRGQVIETARAERREVALADGSVVQVDPETRLRIKYEERGRYVFLERGRALFHVAKNKERPFLVQAHDTEVRAVGTAFAVEQQSSAVLVTVAEGKVAVMPSVAQGASASASSRSHSTSPEVTSGRGTEKAPPSPATRLGETGSAAAPNGFPQEIFLSANQQVTVTRSGSAEAVKEIDSGRALAWAEGRLVFEYTTIGDAIRQFNRYNSIQLVVRDSELADRSISGVFNAADPESFVAFIQSVTSVKVTSGNGSELSIAPAN
jgi:transmembrane sensor